MASLPGLPLVSYIFLLMIMLVPLSLTVVADHKRMEQDELVGLFEVMASLLEDPDWAHAHPYPCTETPWPGVECGEELEESDNNDPLFHVTKIHLGPDVLFPPCKPSATLSPSLVKLPYLKTLSILNCFTAHPVSLPPSIFDNSFSSLEHISIMSNPSLVGHIPQSLGQVISLKVLNLGQNNLQGVIPNEIGKLETLEQLDLSFNNLSGSIPEEVGDLKSLTILDLSWNRLNGTIPSSIGQVQQLQKLDLSSNNLVGAIPPRIGQLSNLVLLDLTHNAISGPIPETLAGLAAHIQYLLISNNPINSNIPTFLQSLKTLTTLSLSSCGLEGEIPTFLPSLGNLTSISLDNNSLNGTVPANLATIPHLNHLNLSFNRLQGELLLPEHFINRLGSRLDMEGNTELIWHCGLNNNPPKAGSSSTRNKTWISAGRHGGGDPPRSKSNQSGSPRVTMVILQTLILTFVSKCTT